MDNSENPPTEPHYVLVLDSQAHSFQVVIRWKVGQLQTKGTPTPESSIHRSLIIDLHGFVEAYLSELLTVAMNVHLPQSFDLYGGPRDTASNRLIDDFDARVESATWSQYDELVRIALGKGLSKMLPNETWKGLQQMTILRNMLSHGKGIRHSASRNNAGSIEVKFRSKYSTVYDYLLEKKVLKPLKTIGTPVQLISKDTVNHFIDVVNDFVAAMLDALPEDITSSVARTTSMQPLPRI